MWWTQSAGGFHMPIQSLLKWSESPSLCSSDNFHPARATGSLLGLRVHAVTRSVQNFRAGGSRMSDGHAGKGARAWPPTRRPLKRGFHAQKACTRKRQVPGSGVPWIGRCDQNKATWRASGRRLPGRETPGKGPRGQPHRGLGSVCHGRKYNQISVLNCKWQRGGNR